MKLFGIGDEYFPIDGIRYIRYDPSGRYIVYFKDSYELSSVTIATESNIGEKLRELEGSGEVSSVIPNPESMNLWDVFEDDGKYVAELAKHLVICRDGCIRSINFLDGYQEFNENLRNYRGLFDKSGLDYNFKNLQFGWEN